MISSYREIPVAILQHEGTVHDVEWFDLMRNVYDHCITNCFQQLALHSTCVMIAAAKVSCECDDGHGMIFDFVRLRYLPSLKLRQLRKASVDERFSIFDLKMGNQ